MEHGTQVEILKELMQQLDEGKNIDAGVQVRMPTSGYVDPDIAAKERALLFRDHPQLVGLSGDLPEPGSYLTLDDFGVPILATRDKEGRFHAFLNACRHRSVKVATEERGRLIVQDQRGLVDLPMPNLLGAHQIGNAGTAVVALRQLGFGEDAATGAVTSAEWPARMQRLKSGPVVDAVPGAEVWLDGGHNVAAAKALAAHLAGLPERETWIIAGMIHTKDASGYFDLLTDHVAGGYAIEIPDEEAAIPADVLATQAGSVGLNLTPAASIEAAAKEIANRSVSPRILICGSLYLAGRVLADHG